MRRPTPTLRLAVALAAENLYYPERLSRADQREVWRSSTPEARRHWLRKARRVLARLEAQGGLREVDA